MGLHQGFVDFCVFFAQSALELVGLYGGQRLVLAGVASCHLDSVLKGVVHMSFKILLGVANLTGWVEGHKLSVLPLVQRGFPDFMRHIIGRAPFQPSEAVLAEHVLLNDHPPAGAFGVRCFLQVGVH